MHPIHSYFYEEKFDYGSLESKSGVKMSYANSYRQSRQSIEIDQKQKIYQANETLCWT